MNGWVVICEAATDGFFRKLMLSSTLGHKQEACKVSRGAKQQLVCILENSSTRTEQFSYRAESRNHIGSILYKLSSLMGFERNCLLICLSSAFTWMLRFDTIMQYLCFYLKKWICCWAISRFLQVFYKAHMYFTVLAAPFRTWLWNEKVDYKAETNRWCFDFNVATG